MSNSIFENVCEYLYNMKVLIITGLRQSPHAAHAHFDLSFKWITTLKPDVAYLTHLSMDSDYDKLLKLCPKNVKPAYDGMILEI